MFPTFDVPPAHAETVGARKNRKAREEEATRRSSTATSQSSGSGRSVRAESNASSKKGGFGWFGKSKGVQEIPKVPALKTKLSETTPPPVSVAALSCKKHHRPSSRLRVNLLLRFRKDDRHNAPNLIFNINISNASMSHLRCNLSLLRLLVLSHNCLLPV